MVVTQPLGMDLDQYKYGFHDPEQYTFKSCKGSDREIVEMISTCPLENSSAASW